MERNQVQEQLSNIREIPIQLSLVGTYSIPQETIRLEEYDRAIADYTEAIRLNPEHADAYYNRGISYKKLGQYDQACEDIQKSADYQ